jgi:hypothetical protein
MIPISCFQKGLNGVFRKLPIRTHVKLISFHTTPRPIMLQALGHSDENTNMNRVKEQLSFFCSYHHLRTVS